MLSIAKTLLAAEAKEAQEERVRYMEEHCPPLSLPGSMQELQVRHQPITSSASLLWRAGGEDGGVGLIWGGGS